VPDSEAVSGWYAMLVLAADVNVPAPMPHGHAVGLISAL